MTKMRIRGKRYRVDSDRLWLNIITLMLVTAAILAWQGVLR